jgi:hypothetical protein
MLTSPPRTAPACMMPQKAASRSWQSSCSRVAALPVLRRRRQKCLLCLGPSSSCLPSLCFLVFRIHDRLVWEKQQPKPVFSSSAVHKTTTVRQLHQLAGDELTAAASSSFTRVGGEEEEARTGAQEEGRALLILAAASGVIAVYARPRPLPPLLFLLLLAG